MLSYGMNTPAPRSAIARTIAHNNGPAAFARKLGLAHQQACLWIRQGYAPPEHYLRIEPLAPPGVGLRELLLDLKRYKTKRRKEQVPA